MSGLACSLFLDPEDGSFEARVCHRDQILIDIDLDNVTNLIDCIETNKDFSYKCGKNTFFIYPKNKQLVFDSPNQTITFKSCYDKEISSLIQDYKDYMSRL